MFLWFDFHRTDILYGGIIILPDIERFGFSPYRYTGI